MTRLLAIGECMIEMSPTPEGTYAMGFAGDTFNTAWYARKLGGEELEVAYYSAVGDDEPSARMAGFMRGAGVVPELAVRKGGTVGLYMISLKDGERSFSYWRSAAAARSLAEGLDRLPAGKGDIALFSGITMAILPEAGRRRLLEVLAAARADGLRVAFDPNLRPRLWASDAEMCHWVSEAAKVADIALPSYEDEASYFGDVSKRATADRYAAAGASLVLAKDGPEPVLVLENGTETLVPPQIVTEVTDTTAAGDAFNAGVLSALARGLPAAEAADLGCRVSAQVVTRRGALVEIDLPGIGLPA
ncbi:sugar kinase [Mangrovicoccus algicola]|uniref:Sugar kinase n=1 Tax=Mangrovicoccus algicola TaxID=2771008 RepID=A0A8J6YXG5_9RHOB|nr:sugar kinase [Mangrovicoccus algicola]MBE3638209.1 sugar kinase [Mangrovicoccus algicola]